jgi:hypothetical protein
MRREFQGALRGIKQPLALHHRAMMLIVGFAFVYMILWVLHLLYAAKHLLHAGLSRRTEMARFRQATFQSVKIAL